VPKKERNEKGTARQSADFDNGLPMDTTI
jgi:hypothetical protein